MKYPQYLETLEEKSLNRIKKLHHFAKRLWKDKGWSPIEIQNKCLDTWDDLASNMDCKILPLVPLKEEKPFTTVIFGSGSFSTGEFQAQQFQKIAEMLPNPPSTLEGIVTNKSSAHGCNAQTVANNAGLKCVELDFEDWYHENIDKLEPNPIRATRYLYGSNEENSPSLSERARRFKLRQDKFHKELGERIIAHFPGHLDVVSARGYNFQFSSSLFSHQRNLPPHINDTHPADLSFIDKDSKAKLYAGWQSGAIKKMMKNAVHKLFRGSLIEVAFMDSPAQMNELDEGALLALGEGVNSALCPDMSAKEIQNAMKIIDDHFYCTFEAVGLNLFFGITDCPVPVVYQDIYGNPVIVQQKAVVVGPEFRSGTNAWGKDIDADLANLSAWLGI